MAARMLRASGVLRSAARLRLHLPSAHHLQQQGYLSKSLAAGRHLCRERMWRGASY